MTEARMYQPRPWNEKTFLFLTLSRLPERRETVILECQGKEVPRENFNILVNQDTGQQHVYMKEATRGDCCTAYVKIVTVEKVA